MTSYTEVFYMDLFHYSSSVLNGFYVFLISIFIHQFIKFSRVFHSHLDKPTCSSEIKKKTSCQYLTRKIHSGEEVLPVGIQALQHW